MTSRTNMESRIPTSILRSARRWAVALGGAALGLSGCASDLQPLTVTGFYALQAPITPGAPCLVTGGGMLQLAQGTYDPSRVYKESVPQRAAGYVVGMEVLNNLVGIVEQPGGPGVGDLRVPSNDAQITMLSAQYSWSSTDGSVVELPDRDFPISVTVGPTLRVAFPATILSSADNAKLKQKTGTLSVRVTLSGTLADGSAVSSTPATFAIAVVPDILSDTCPSGQVLDYLCGPDAAAQPDGRTCITDTTAGEDG